MGRVQQSFNIKLRPPSVGHWGYAGYINLYAYTDEVLKMESLILAYQPISAIRTYHDEKTKNEFLSDMPTTERTDVEWKRMRKSDLA
jgi:hypothetical protein